MSPRAGGALAAALYDPLREWLEELPPQAIPDVAALNALCDSMPLSGGGVPLRFVRAGRAQSRSFAGQYEVRTCLRGEIEVRDGSWHDLFNALAWLAFPRTKAAINKRHYQELDRERAAQGRGEDEPLAPAGRRSPARDALTLFDESGIIVASPSPELLDLLRNHQWKALFWERRARVLREMRFLVIGHALHEKALKAYKSMTARALLLVAPESVMGLSVARLREYADEQAARQVQMADCFDSTRSLSPLPVMGIPGWSDNDEPDFYDDPEVFR